MRISNIRRVSTLAGLALMTTLAFGAVSSTAGATTTESAAQVNQYWDNSRNNNNWHKNNRYFERSYYQNQYSGYRYHNKHRSQFNIWRYDRGFSCYPIQWWEAKNVYGPQTVEWRDGQRYICSPNGWGGYYL